MVIADRWDGVRRWAWLLTSLLLSTSVYAGSSHEAHVCDVLTIAPFQTATFVDNPEAAALLNDLAEFSTRLLRWEDTPREPVVAADRLVRSGYIPFYHSWRGDEVPVEDLSMETVAARVSAGFAELQSPRLVRVAMGETVEATWDQPIEHIAGLKSAFPLLLKNQRDATLSATLKAHHGEDVVFIPIRLRPGQTTGLWMELPDAFSRDAWTFSLELSEGAHDITIPVNRIQSGELQVKVVDEEGQPLAARVYLTASNRKAYAPSGVMPRIVLADRKQAAPGECYFHTQGLFELTLPEGEARIEVVRGMEYEPVKTVVAVMPGEKRTVKIVLKRLAHLAAQGWFSGDVHVHGNLFAQDVIGPSDVLAVAKAEDINVMNILPCNDPRTTIISDGHYFTGRPDAVSEQNYLVYYNEEMRNDLYGHVGFLNLKTFVEPAYFGWPHSPHPYDYPANYPQVEQALKQGAFVTYVHPGLPSELPVDIALGLAHTIDVMSQNDERVTMPLWYRLLNCGFRCPASAGTDSFLNIPYHLVPGAGRVYVKTGSKFTYDHWIQAFKAGRTFVTNGPLLDVTFNGQDPGHEFAETGGSYQLTVKGTARSIMPMESVEIVVNGEVVRRIEGTNDRFISINETLTLARSAWVAVRTIGPGHRWVTNDQDTFAHTSPVYVTLDGHPFVSAGDAAYLSEQIDVLIAKMDAQGKFRDASQRDEIVARFRQAQTVYSDLIESMRDN